MKMEKNASGDLVPKLEDEKEDTEDMESCVATECSHNETQCSLNVH
jgi:hypothetical protein